MLSGYKTYITGVVAIITVWGGYLTGTVDLSMAINTTVTALMGMFIRNGVTTTAAK